MDRVIPQSSLELCQVSEIGPIAGAVESISHLMSPAHWNIMHTLANPVVWGLFGCAWPFDRRYLLIIHWCIMFTDMPCILKQNNC